MNEVELKKMILEKEQEGKIVVLGPGTLMSMDLDDFIKQPVEGMLYDLNRDAATVLTFINDRKWINDYACGLVIKKLKEKLDGKENL